jgi:sugar/nucleoside kinase (ribokinase family)
MMQTGAGDAYCSGFLAGRIKGYSVKESLEIARRRSAYIIQRDGAGATILSGCGANFEF